MKNMTTDIWRCIKIKKYEKIEKIEKNKKRFRIKNYSKLQSVTPSCSWSSS